MFHVVWCLRRGDNPRSIFCIWGAVASFDTLPEAKSFARKGHPMHKGWYRVVR